jgi:hypothetical protein
VKRHHAKGECQADHVTALTPVRSPQSLSIGSRRAIARHQSVALEIERVPFVEPVPQHSRDESHLPLAQAWAARSRTASSSFVTVAM